MKSYPAYADYKDSGIDWIGQIPKHWEVRKLKYCVQIQKGKNPLLIESKYTSGALPYLSMEYLRGKSSEPYYITNFQNCIQIQESEILVLWDGANAGEFILGKKGVLSSTMAVISVNHLNQVYSWFSFKNFEKLLKNETIGMGIPHINPSFLKNTSFSIPPLCEQQAIAEFLEKKATEIDRAIAQKEAMIALLRERQQILITQAVTKGLDSKSEMRDSGIDWIGQIPKHWEVKKLKYVAKLNPSRSNHGLNKFKDQEIIFLPMENVFEDWTIKQDRIGLLKDFWQGYTYFEKGDIILAKITPCFENGKGAYLQELKTSIGFGSTEFHVFRLNKNLINPFFFSFLLRNMNFKSLAKEFMVGTAGQQRVTTSFLSNLCIPIPPLSEQQAIADYIEKNNEQTEKAIALQQQTIERLKEYKTVLISQAVTGKIKVTDN